MSSDNNRPCRDWREIAADASHEKDTSKLNELAQELDQALAERDKKLKEKGVKPKSVTRKIEGAA